MKELGFCLALFAFTFCVFSLGLNLGNKSVSEQPLVVQWMNDKTPTQGISSEHKWMFIFATNNVELGIRSDGVVVWREGVVK